MRFGAVVSMGLVLGPLLAGGCRDNVAPGASALFRDSAGIRIVESAAPHLGPADQWKVSSRPLLELGVVEGDWMELFDGIVGAVRLADGRLVIMNCAEPMLRWFSADGELLHATGRTGGGPDEFGAGACRGGARLWRLPDDSVATWEHTPRRMHVFDADGRYTRSTVLGRLPLGAYGRQPQMLGRLADDEFIVYLRESGGQHALGDVWRDTLSYFLYTPDGTYDGPITRLPGNLWMQAELWTVGGQFATQTSPPFSSAGLAWAHGERLYYSSNDRYEIRVYDLLGAQRMAIRTLKSPARLTNRLLDDYKSERLERTSSDSEGGPEASRHLERHLATVPYPETVPTYTRLRVDPGGYVWTQHFNAPGIDVMTWSIFHPDGRWWTDLELPTEMEILDFGLDYVLASVTDTLGVQRVRLYSLLRNGE